MHTTIVEATQPWGNVIPAHDFWKPYDGVDNPRSAWLARNDKEKISIIMANIYTNISFYACTDSQTYEQAVIDFIALLQREIDTWEALSGITDEGDTEILHMIHILTKNVQHLKQKLPTCKSQTTKTDEVVSALMTTPASLT